MAAGQEIAPLPPVRDIERRQRADKDFRFFCENYFPKVFRWPWSRDHLRVIEKIERVVVYNDTLAVAMPRGSGKTSLCMVAVIWAVMTGRHSFVVLVSQSEEEAEKAIANVKSHLTSSKLLLADYPEAVYPIHRLEGESDDATASGTTVPTRSAGALTIR